jgi:protocatechuate 3,4-dioxygenase beta subunit
MRRYLAFIAVLSLLSSITAPAQGPGQIAPPPREGGQRTPARPGMPQSDQPAPTGTAVIRGYIVGMETGAPIRRAVVRAFATELRGSRVATTDPQGRYEFADLPAGRYTLSASKAGYVSLQYGQRRPMQPGTPIEIRDKQILEKVTIGLPRGSVLAGRITDEFGEPVANANVTAMQWRRIGGTSRWTGSGPPARTDDLGQFRLFGLSPGQYAISATAQGDMMFERAEPSGETTGFAPTYFPGVPSLNEAQRITLGVAEENTNASFALVATRLVTVEGTVTSAQGGPVTQGMVSLMPADTMGTMMFMGPGNMGRIEQNGRFRINNVPPGRYVAQVNSGRGGESGEIGRVSVTVGSEKVENVGIVMMPGGRITGRVITDTGAPLPSVPDMGGMRVFANPVTPGSSMMFGGGEDNGRVRPNGTFELRGLVDPRRINVSSPPDWMVRSVIVSGRDYIDSPIEVEPGQVASGMEIILTNKVAKVTGQVSDSRGQAVLDASILIFPDDRQFWQPGSRYIRTGRPDQEGRFRVDRLPPHNAYLAIAVQDIGEGQATDPDYLASLQQAATRFSVREGEAATVDLKLRQ